MIPNDVGQTLHDQATRGESLTSEDRARLTEWYAQLDEEEGR